MTLPLSGRRILVSRPAQQSAELERLLEKQGAEVVLVPLVEIVPLPVDAELAALLASTSVPEVFVFTSANAVRVFNSLWQAAESPFPLTRGRLFAVGPQTAHALSDLGLQAEPLPAEYTGAALAEAIVAVVGPGTRILLPRAEGAAESLPERLRRAGAEVISVPIYRSALPRGAAQDLEWAWRSGPIDVITFASGSAVRGLFEALGTEVARSRADRSRVACLGPATAEVARGLGLRVDIIPRQYTSEALAEAITESYFVDQP